MLRNYLIIAWRNLLRNKFISFINIGGLAIGMATFMIIAIYVSHELSYDDFFEKQDRIFRYSEFISELDKDFKYENAVASGRKQFLSQIPQIEKIARLHHSTGTGRFVSVYNEDQQDRITFEETAVYKTEQEFLDIFDIHFLYGNRESALTDIYTVVISKSIAIKYFGKCSRDLLGKSLFMSTGNADSKFGFTITGIFDDFPQNTHLDIDIMASYITWSTKDPEMFEEGYMWEFHTYLLLHKSNELKITGSEMPGLTDTLYASYYNKPVQKYAQIQDGYYKFVPDIQPLSSIYFTTPGELEFWKHGNKSHVPFLVSIALITLLIAWINYVNLSLVQIMTRAKEAGVRKVIGANRGAIASQFMIETLIANFIALLISVTIISLALPYMHVFIGKSLGMSIWFNGLPNDGLFWFMLIALFFISFLVTGLYPSIAFSNTKPVIILKNQSYGIRNRLASGKNIRAAFVFTQFTSAYILLGVTLGIYLQLNFLQQKELGFNQEQILVIQSPLKDSLNMNKIEYYNEKLKAENISNTIGLSSSVPGKRKTIDVGIHNIPANQHWSNCNMITADAEYVHLFNFKFLAGRNFSDQYESDKNAIIINEKLFSDLGYHEPNDIIGHEINLYGADPSVPMDESKRRIIGVIENYHHLSPKEDYIRIAIIQEGGELTVIRNGERMIKTKNDDRSFISLSVRADEIQKTVASANKLWNEIFPGFNFKYFFVDQNYDTQYRAELKFGTTFLVLTIISIGLACLGFLGMSLFLINRRTKEIGIRKILGASLTNLFGLMIYRFLLLILFAGLVGIPFTWFILKNLLNEFAYRIDLSWWLFAAPLGLILIISLVTIGGNTLRKVNANPVKALRYE